MAEGRYIVVGGGLAGLMTVIKLAEAGKHVDVFSIVPVKRSHSVCAQGGINGAVNTKGEGDHPDIHFDDTLKRRRLPRRPAAGQGHVLRGAGHHLPARPHGRDLQPHRRRGFSTSGASAARSTTAPPSPAPPPASSCSTRSTSRCAATRSRGWSRKYEYWEFLGMRAGRRRRAAAASWPWTCARMELQAFPADAVMPGHRRPRRHLRPLHQLGHQHRLRRRRAPTSRARSTPTASSSRSTPPPSPARTSCG